jgi:transposase-like protein
MNSIKTGGKAYKNVVRDLRQVEPDLLTFYNYPPAIRASIYSTNMIESFNNRLKRKTKPKTEFPTEQSLDTFIGVQEWITMTVTLTGFIKDLGKFETP